MNIIKVKSSSKLNKKRPGRGISSGQGKTAGRGTKGQKSRSGHNIPKRHEGGQTPLSMRLPKLPGFKHQSQKVRLISLDQISENFKDGDVVSLESLIKKLLIKKGEKVKILNNGKLKVKVEVSDISISKSAKTKFVTSNPEKAKTVKKKTTQAPKSSKPVRNSASKK